MRIRFFCQAHRCALEDVGNGRVFFPTACLEPIVIDGWRELDMSEMDCPGRIAEEGQGAPCDIVFQSVDDTKISDATTLTDEGWIVDRDEVPGESACR